MRAFELNVLNFKVTASLVVLVIVGCLVSSVVGLQFWNYSLWYVALAGVVFVTFVVGFVFWLTKQSFKNTISLNHEGIHTSGYGLIPWNDICWCSWEVSKGIPSIHINRITNSSVRITSGSKSKDDELCDFYAELKRVHDELMVENKVYFYRNRINKRLIMSIVVLLVFIALTAMWIGSE
jgi:hypothetical protein